MSQLTEGQPGLLNLQVNIEVGGEADVPDGGRRLFVVVVLPVAVPNPCRRNNSSSHSLLPTQAPSATAAPTLPGRSGLQDS